MSERFFSKRKNYIPVYSMIVREHHCKTKRLWLNVLKCAIYKARIQSHCLATAIALQNAERIGFIIGHLYIMGAKPKHCFLRFYSDIPIHIKL